MILIPPQYNGPAFRIEIPKWKGSSIYVKILIGWMISLLVGLGYLLLINIVLLYCLLLAKEHVQQLTELLYVPFTYFLKYFAFTLVPAFVLVFIELIIVDRITKPKNEK